MPEKVDAAPRPESDGRATRWDDHKADRRDRILDAAMAAIDEGGADIGVKQIAERAGVPRSVVYRVFKDRGDLDEQLRARILERLMEHVTPGLTPEGTIEEAIANAVDNYLRWIVESPRLHQFLGIGSASHRTTGSRAVTGTKTAIAVQLSAMLDAILRTQGKDPALAETMAFGLIGLVDVSVNRWLSSSQSEVGIDQLADFLTVSIWQVLDGNLRRMGVTIDPTTPVSRLF
ncbi:TetR/AcrR family transcriptional regulator [Rhodococcus spelaei]|uniref:TetR/AcrR family transcriptional regulator n=1 Tax=Rhodococcus spelaei TaxID=2546320 RepID=A0A541B9U9_9NOCA|nr:TetR/AcrR family transcriptional regulator [Rhodococcus spelaei]TQF69110.1 TetR/AcrR family transcriptional regulator [Rhodococcus spelaei]